MLNRANSVFQPKWNIVTVLTLSMVLTIALLMSLSTFLEIRREQGIFRTQLEKRGLVIFGAMEDTANTDSGLLGELERNRLIAMIDGRPDVSRFQLYTPEGTLLVDYDISGNLTNLRPNLASNATEPEVTFPDRLLQIAGPLKADEQVLGFVLLQFNSFEFRDQIRELAIQRILQSLALIAIGIAISYLIARRFASPIKKLSEASKAIGKGDLVVSTGVDPSRNDEIGELAASFTNMTRALRESREQLDKALQDERHNAEELAKANETNLAIMRELEIAQERNIQNAKMAALGQLAGGVAHEINNPLAAILGFSQLGKKKLESLHDKEISPDDISYMERYLDYIDTQAKRCGEIVSRMITYNLSPGNEKADLNINELIQQTIRMNTNHMLEAGIETDLHLTENLPNLEGHEAGLIQAFNNVVANAIVAMPEGGTFRVESHLIEAESPDDYAYIELCFQDTGVGIPDENIPKVIEPFFTTAEPGQGTGLGMYSSYQVIQGHEGDLHIESDEGEGTTVKITFRVPKSEDEAKAELNGNVSDD